MSPHSSTTTTKTPCQRPLYELIEQNIHVVPSFTLECGVVLKNAPVAYKTWGRLNASRDNVMIICHALTGSADVQDWWGPMMGRGKAFDPALFFIVCLNVLGSPYGSASPLTLNPDTGKPYGPEFPPTTIRDDVKIHKLVLDDFGVASIAAIIGGSMGGMHVLEWPLCTPPGYVRHIVPLATSVSHSAWCIAWSEAQRQALCADPAFNNGWYDEQPRAGLAAARVCAMLTYRSRASFGLKFGRRKQTQKMLQPLPNKVEEVKKLRQDNDNRGVDTLTPPPSPPIDTHASADGASIVSLTLTPAEAFLNSSDPNTTKSPFSAIPAPAPAPAPVLTFVSHAQRSSPPTPLFCAQSYLRYQGQKFLARFDANCFIHITHKMDTHDISRGRPAPPTSCPCMRPVSPASSYSSTPECDRASSISSYSDTDLELDTDLDTRCALARLPPRALVISISSDNLFVPAEQRLIAAHIPGARLVLIDSVDGHDGFLLEFEAMNRHIVEFLRREEPGIYVGEEKEGDIEGFEVRKTSVFGEAEVEGEIP
ncbi:hypothetical protein C0993_004531 [Termitomyces sp. T159_Od127]|nr:hypothetical protein C0993_004531 [Termitomyces sp. T159_Od127]